DILLGGNPEGLARERLRKEGVDLAALRQDDPIWLNALAQARAECEADREKVVAVGGLHVLGTERHEARRIDNQLRGRAGRQGDPGSSRFYVALDDDLMRRFGGQSVSALMERLGLDEDVPIEAGLVSKAIESAQMRVEGYNFDIRKHVLEYDDVVNKQREIIYSQRRQILSEPTMRPTIMGMIQDEIRSLVQQFAGSPDREEWDLAGLAAELNKIIFPPHGERPESWRRFDAAGLTAHLIELAEKAYDAKEAAMGADLLRQLERLVMLRAVDNRWVRHLTDLDELREGIGLRAFGQQDPLVAYKKEAHEMYEELIAAISHDIVYSIYHAQIMVRPTVPQHLQTNRGDGDGRQPVRTSKTPGRNDPCWCGSGKKYKHCHLRADQGREPAPAAKQASRPAAAPPQPAPAAARKAPGGKSRRS
ncbi:MAG: SEC-C metal-binding domain-containing protein, partial [Anaerolineae bacterium]